MSRLFDDIPLGDEQVDDSYFGIDPLNNDPLNAALDKDRPMTFSFAGDLAHVFTPAELAALDYDDLHEYMEEFIEESGDWRSLIYQGLSAYRHERGLGARPIGED